MFWVIPVSCSKRASALLTLKYVQMENVVYVAPVVEVIEVEVEKGFATSDQQEDSPWEDL